MAIAVLVLWMFTAGAGLFMLLRSGLGRSQRSTDQAQTPPPPVPASVGAGEELTRREAKRRARRQFDPPSLVRAKSQPAVPGLRAVVEFLHPAFAITGLGFWFGYTFIHARTLAWIAFGLIAVTACAGLAWLAANIRAARRNGPAGPSFPLRLALLHGAAAALTLTLAALTALTARG